MPYERKLWLTPSQQTDGINPDGGPMQAAAKELDRMKLYGLRHTGPQINELSIAFTSQQWTGWWLTNMIPETAGQDIGERETNSMTVLFIEPDAYQRKPQNASGHPGLAAINPNVPDHLPDMWKVYQNMLWAWLVYGVCDPQKAGLVTEALSSVTFTTPDKLETLSHAAVETQQGRNNRTQYVWRQAIKSFIEVHSEITGLDNVIARVMEFPRWVDYMPNPQKNGPVGQVGKFVTNASRLRRNQGLHVDGGQYDMVNAFSSGLKVYRRES
ncbi:putative virion structural protein [Salmonella phage SPFM15]|nr:putative virion structural protein [Salmonella phage SPFM15]